MKSEALQNRGSDHGREFATQNFEPGCSQPTEPPHDSVSREVAANSDAKSRHKGPETGLAGSDHGRTLAENGLSRRGASRNLTPPPPHVGRWSVLGPADPIGPDSLTAWLCRCDCGTERAVAGSVLRKGRSRSCGCAIEEGRLAKIRTHGMSQTPEHRAWDAMQSRCFNEKSDSYPNYGARGITVCARWLGPGGFVHFFEDMGPRPSARHSLDRYPNNNGNYEKDNCRWATRAEQGRNKRSNRPLTLNGRTMLLTEWAESVGITTKLLFERLGRGWSLEAALAKDLIPHKQRKKGFYPWSEGAEPKDWLLAPPRQCEAQRGNPREPGRCKNEAAEGQPFCWRHGATVAVPSNDSTKETG